MYSSVPTIVPCSVNSVRSVEPLADRLRDAEVDHLRHRPAVVRVTSTLDGLRSRWMTPFWCACCTRRADLDEQLQPRAVDSRLSVAVLGDRHASTSSMTKYGPAVGRRARVEHRAMFG